MTVYYWVAKVDKKYDYAYELFDGPHDDEEGAAVGLFLHQRLFNKRDIAIVRVEQICVKKYRPETLVNMDSVAECKEMLEKGE